MTKLTVHEIHQKISEKSRYEQYFIQAPTKILTRQTKGDIKHSEKLYGKHPPGIHPAGYTRLTKKR
jgi:hypothetical protein